MFFFIVEKEKMNNSQIQYQKKKLSLLSLILENVEGQIIHPLEIGLEVQKIINADSSLTNFEKRQLVLDVTSSYILQKQPISFRKIRQGNVEIKVREPVYEKELKYVQTHMPRILNHILNVLSSSEFQQGLEVTQYVADKVSWWCCGTKETVHKTIQPMDKKKKKKHIRQRKQKELFPSEQDILQDVETLYLKLKNEINNENVSVYDIMDIAPLAMKCAEGLYESNKKELVIAAVKLYVERDIENEDLQKALFLAIDHVLPTLIDKIIDMFNSELFQGIVSTVKKKCCCCCEG